MGADLRIAKSWRIDSVSGFFLVPGAFLFIAGIMVGLWTMVSRQFGAAGRRQVIANHFSTDSEDGTERPEIEFETPVGVTSDSSAASDRRRQPSKSASAFP